MKDKKKYNDLFDKPRFNLGITFPEGDKCQIQISSLYSLEHIADRYYLTEHDLVFNVVTGFYSIINIMQSGYPYSTFLAKDNTWKKVTLHKIIALARINNGPYKEIEHLNDNPLDLRYCNLKFSDHKSNMKRAFENNKRDCPSGIFRLHLINGQKFIGTMVELSKKTNISRMTLYDRFYKKKIIYTPNGRSKIKSVEKVKDAPPIKKLSKRFIDYRKGKFHGELEFEKFILEI